MSFIRFIVNARNKAWSIWNDEISLTKHNLKTHKTIFIMTDGTRILPNKEIFVTAKIIRPGGLRARLV